MSLLLRIVIAIAAGIGAGMILPVWAAQVFTTFNAIFSTLLGFIIPLLIVGFVAPPSPTPAAEPAPCSAQPWP